VKLSHPIIPRVTGYALAETLKCWMSTMDCQLLYADWKVDPGLGWRTRPGIFCFWHEYIPLLCYCRQHTGITMLISQHRDADLLPPVAKLLGFGVVRGSSKRGGVAAIRQVLRKTTHGQMKHLAITPDGPRGPRRVFNQGAIYLASRLQIPIIPIGIGFDRPWRINSWDQFAVPRPFSRARAIVGHEVEIPPDACRDTIESNRKRMGDLLNQLTIDAETWAESGKRYEGQQPLLRQPTPRGEMKIAPRRVHRFVPLQQRGNADGKQEVCSGKRAA
jgi:lysophospholipid acyltransferase (LPLAT)-like uncharacterized protein